MKLFARYRWVGVQVSHSPRSWVVLLLLVWYNYQLSKVSLVTGIKWPIREECGNIFSIIKCEKLFTFGNIFGIFCVIAARPQPRGPGVVMAESNCPAV